MTTAMESSTGHRTKTRSYCRLVLAILFRKQRILHAGTLCCALPLFAIFCAGNSLAITPDEVVALLQDGDTRRQSARLANAGVLVPVMEECSVLPEVAIYSYPVFPDWADVQSEILQLSELIHEKLPNMKESTANRVINEQVYTPQRLLDVRVIIWPNGYAIWKSDKIEHDGDKKGGLSQGARSTEFRFARVPASEMRDFRARVSMATKSESQAVRREVNFLHSTLYFSIQHRELLVHNDSKWHLFRSQVMSPIDPDLRALPVNAITSPAHAREFLDLQEEIMSMLPSAYQVISPVPAFHPRGRFPRFSLSIPGVPVHRN